MSKINIVIAILIFGALIFIHELGHYICARIFGVGIKEFAIGMGPRLCGFASKKTGIKYNLRLLPLGGFVSMIGEDEESSEENAFCRKPVWQRLIVTMAGAVMNILLGIILTCIIVASSSLLGGTTIQYFADDAITNEWLQVGDTIVKLGDTDTHIAYELAYAIMREAYQPVDVTVIRNGEEITLEKVGFPVYNSSDGVTYGDYDFSVGAEEKTFGNVIRHSFYRSLASVKMIWQSLFDLLTGRYGVEAVSGPVGTTKAIGDAASGGIQTLLSLTALITLNLGIFNLLPLPALDGGRIVFQLVELIRRKPVKPEYEGYVHFIGIVLLMALMLFVTYKDIMKLII